MVIRQLRDGEFSIAYDLIKDAFKTSESCEGREQDYVSDLRKSEKFIPELEYIIEDNGYMIGYALMTNYNIGFNLKCLTLGPVCVDINFRNRGLGRSLIDVVCKKATDLGFDVVFLAGNPKYYERMGFKSTIEYGLKNSNGFEDRLIMCKELKKGSLDNIEGEFVF